MQDLIELSGSAKELQLCLLAQETRIQIGHPLFIFVQPGAFHIAKVRFAFSELRLQDTDILLRELQFKARDFFRGIGFLNLAGFLANLGGHLVFGAGQIHLRGI